MKLRKIKANRTTAAAILAISSFVGCAQRGNPIGKVRVVDEKDRPLAGAYESPEMIGWQKKTTNFSNMLPVYNNPAFIAAHHYQRAIIEIDPLSTDIPVVKLKPFVHE